MRILLVKLSSMGDVIHNLPVVNDIRRAIPDAQIDWVTDVSYAQLVSLHSGVNRVLPLRLRSLKSQWYSLATWHQVFADKTQIGREPYDLIIDTQGLVKSAVVSNWARGPKVGYDAESIREPLASRWYERRYTVSRQAHAVTRNRALCAAALGYELIADAPPDYGLQLTQPDIKSLPKAYVVCLHATSRADKQWPTANWRALGKTLNDRGLHVAFPSGTDAEYATSEALAQSLPNASAWRALPLPETAARLSAATAVVGCDTGLAHLAVALSRPCIGIYLSTAPALTGLFGTGATNLGGGSRERLASVSVADVLDTLLPQVG
jgi:heptosyltransferase I